jgi:hypothetical protein
LRVCHLQTNQIIFCAHLWTLCPGLPRALQNAIKRFTKSQEAGFVPQRPNFFAGLAEKFSKDLATMHIRVFRAWFCAQCAVWGWTPYFEHCEKLFREEIREYFEHLGVSPPLS